MLIFVLTVFFQKASLQIKLSKKVGICMWIVWEIFRWLGIIIGGILGISLFFGLLVLFVPVRYGIKGKSKEELVYSFKISWLFSLVSIHKKMKSEKIVLRILGIPIKCLTEPKKKKGKETESEEKKEEKKEKIKEKKKPYRKRENIKREKKKKNFSFGKLSSIIALAKEKTNQRAVSKLFKELKMLIRYVAPRQVKGSVVVGTGDPCTTGLLLGGISLLPVIYEDNLQITPDFEEKRLEAEGCIKGRLRVIYFMRLILRLYQDRELKRLWRQINQLKKEAA